VFQVIRTVPHDGPLPAVGKNDFDLRIFADDVGAGDEQASPAIDDPPRAAAAVGGVDPADAGEGSTVDLGGGKGRPRLDGRRRRGERGSDEEK
jgi:hypothetical protein